MKKLLTALLFATTPACGDDQAAGDAAVVPTDTVETDIPDAADTADTDTADTEDTAETDTGVVDTADTADAEDTVDTVETDTNVADVADTADAQDTEDTAETDTDLADVADTADAQDTEDTVDTAVADTADVTPERVTILPGFCPTDATPAGLYRGTLGGNLNDIAGACGLTAPGRDGAIRVELQPGQTLTATYRHAGDGVLYLLDSCPVIGSCLAGSDDSSSGAETLTWTWSGPNTNPVYLVLDAFELQGPSTFELDLFITP